MLDKMFAFINYIVISEQAYPILFFISSLVIGAVATTQFLWNPIESTRMALNLKNGQVSVLYLLILSTSEEKSFTF